MGTWIKGDKPTPAEKIDFAKDAGGIHLYWAEELRTNPGAHSHELGTPEFHDECAILHSDTAEELEELAKKEGENQRGCLWRKGAK